MNGAVNVTALKYDDLLSLNHRVGFSLLRIGDDFYASQASLLSEPNVSCVRDGQATAAATTPE